MKTLNPPFNKALFFIYFTAGVLFLFVAFAIMITQRDGPGDLPEDFLIIGWTTLAGITIGVISYFVIKSHELKTKVVYCLWVLIRYFLSLVFLSYGFIKIIGLQFYTSLSQLDMKLIDLSKSDMGVAWFFFGHSNSYEMFLGWGETIAALLLLFRRTSILGASFLLAIVTNIVAVNYWFDVSVKINSTYFLLMTLWVLMYQYSRLMSFFILDRSVEAAVYPTFSLKKQKLIKIANALVVLVIIGYNAWDTFYRFPKEYGFDLGKKSSLKGVWKVDELNTELMDTLWTSQLRKAKLYLDDYGLGEIKNDYAIVSNFVYSEKADSVLITQTTYNPDYELKGVFKRDHNSLEIRGEWAKKSTSIKMSIIPEYSPQVFSGIEEKEISVDTTELEKFVGKYKIGSGYIVSLVLRGGKLYRVTENNPDAELIPIGKNRFMYRGRPAYWEFYMSDNGRVTDIVFTTNGTAYSAWRLSDN